MKHSWLSIHADYACRHSGACCTSNWPIPVEGPVVARLEAAVARGVLIVPVGAIATAPGLPEGIGAVLQPNPGGACAFYDSAAAENRCTIHRALGPSALPASCRHFPRVCRIDERGVSVTLSHYCPTAAAMLFRTDRPLAIVAGPEPVPDESPEGLDARDGLPPSLTPSILMDHGAYARWERLVVAIFADERVSAEAAIERVTAAAERLRSWTPGGATLEAALAALESEHEHRSLAVPESGPSPPDLRRFDEVRSCIPAPYAWDPPPADAAAIWLRYAEDTWGGLARPVRFYLAAKAFASWTAYQGEGLRTMVRSLRAAESVVKVELLRLVAQRRAAVDAAMLRQAFRRADLLLVHLADREALARVWSRAEHAGREPRP